MSKPLRSQQTRDRILVEARRLFAEHGFERTTIRAVATAAEITPAMVMRYYGSKEDLFAIAAAVDFEMPDLRQLPESARAEALVSHVLDRWDAGDELPALLRAAATHEVARARLVEAVRHQAAAVIAPLLPARQREERLAVVVMQLAGLVLSRYVLRHPSVAALDRKTLVRVVGAAIATQMAGPSRPGPVDATVGGTSGRTRRSRSGRAGHR